MADMVVIVEAQYMFLTLPYHVSDANQQPTICYKYADLEVITQQSPMITHSFLFTVKYNEVE
jgi:hypothetical protein